MIVRSPPNNLEKTDTTRIVTAGGACANSSKSTTSQTTKKHANSQHGLVRPRVD